MMLKTLRKIFIGNIISQIVGLITIPLLAYYYTVQQIGFYGTFFSLSACTSVVLSLRIENLFFSLSTNDSKFLRNFSIKIIGLITVIILVIINICFLTFELEKEHFYLINLIILAGTTIGIFNIQYNYLVRKANTDKYVRMKNIRAYAELVIVLFCILKDISIEILCIGASLSYIVPVLMTKNFYFGEGKNDWMEGSKIFKNNYKFIINDFFASLFNVTYIYLPTILFYFSGDKGVSGVFFTIARFLGVPSLMIAQSIGTTLKQHASVEYSNKKTVKNSLNFIIKNLILRPLPIYLIIGSIVIVTSYFIEPYYHINTFYITLIMVPLFFIRYIYNCFSSIIYVLKMQRINFFFQFFLLVLPSLGMLIFSDPKSSLLSYSIISIFVYSFFIYYLFYIKKLLINF